MTIQFPDISGYQTGFPLTNLPAPVIVVKATEDGGSGPASRYVNPDYGRVVAAARARAVRLIAYHYLHGVDPVAEADYAMSVIGPGVPTMLDIEAFLANVDDTLAFTAEFRARGGLVHLAYLPRWYWAEILHSPDLRPLAAAGLAIVSSSYVGYSDDGPGWAPYGGVTPSIWQFTDSYRLNGYLVDMNAFRGTVDQLWALVTTGSVLGGNPMRDAVIIRNASTKECRLRIGWYSENIANDSALAAVQVVLRAVGADTLPHDVTADVWPLAVGVDVGPGRRVLLPPAPAPAGSVDVDVTALAAAVVDAGLDRLAGLINQPKQASAR